MVLVTFDLDGVLIKNPFNRHVFPTLARTLGAWMKDGQHLPVPLDADGRPLSVKPEEIRTPGLDDKGREVVAAILAHAAVCLHKGTWRDAYDWDAAAIDVARELGCPEVPDVTRLVEEGCALGLIGQHPGADATLRSLVEGGAKLVALSNGFTRYQKPVLEALGLLEHFTAIVSPEETGYAKPDPRLFHAAFPAAGVPAHTPAFHVGDSLVCDVGGAKAAGMRAIWVHHELPATALAVAPEERPQLPALHQHLSDAAAQEFCGSIYGFSLDQLAPDAIVAHMDEVPGAIRRLVALAHPATA